MNDLISREAVIEMLHYNCDESCSTIIRDVENLSVADAVKVVRCRDCERWDAFADGLDSAGYCYKWHNNVQSDGYCYYRERKED